MPDLSSLTNLKVEELRNTVAVGVGGESAGRQRMLTSEEMDAVKKDFEEASAAAKKAEADMMAAQ